MDECMLSQNLCLKQIELENLISYADLQCGYWKNPSLTFESSPELASTGNEIVFHQFQYKVFREPELVHQNYTAKTSKRRFMGKGENSTSVSSIPYPEESEISLRNLKIIPAPRKFTVYEKICVKISAANRYLSEVTKFREDLLASISGAVIKKMVFIKDVDDYSAVNTAEDFTSLIIESIRIIETSTIETNLIRGLICQVEEWSHSLDAYTCVSFETFNERKEINKSAVASRVLLKEFEEAIDNLMCYLNEFVKQHLCLGRFDDFDNKHKLSASYQALVNCIRYAATYIYSINSKLTCRDGNLARTEKKMNKRNGTV